MADTTIKCPKCGEAIPLTDTLAAPVIERLKQQYEQRIAQERAAAAERERAVNAAKAQVEQKEAALAREKEQMAARVSEQVNEQVRARLVADRAVIERDAEKRASERAAAELAAKKREADDARALTRQMELKLTEAQQAQADFLRKQRELEDQKRELALTIEKQVAARSAEIEETASRRAAEQASLVLAEKDKKLADMSRQIDDLKRKAEQGSQQLQGEVQELALEAALRARFPLDTIEEVAKGEYGGDAVQRVAGPGGQPAGVILWESKRTKTWSDSWLPKLRDDARRAGAEVCVIISQALPKGVESFDCIDGVWIASPRLVLPLAACLRDGLLHVSEARAAAQGQETKMGLVYDYLTGTRFKQRLQAILEAYQTMQDDLEKEKKAITAQWAKRAKQLEQAILGTTGLYGDLQGIVGKSMHEIESLEVKALGG